MVRSSAGRDYRSHTVVEEGGGSFSCWTCMECGSLVGPQRRHRDLHDSWHARIQSLELADD